MRIQRKVLDQIAGHALESLPGECCGILLSREIDCGAVSIALRAENSEEARPEKRYSLGHKAHIEAVKMEASGTARIEGYYHSHPGGGLRFSSTDVEQSVRGLTYLVAAVDKENAEFAAWRMDEKFSVPEPLEIIEQKPPGRKEGD